MQAITETYNRDVLRAQGLIPPPGRLAFLTAKQRIEPSFFIIGVQKGGTSSLSQYLGQHPQLIPPLRKDVYYFNNPEHLAKGQNWYKAHFAHRLYQRWYQLRHGERQTFTFDATPNYFSAPGAAQELHSRYPNAKLILLLRNPVERAWSHFRMNKRHGFEPLSLADALACETERLEAEAAYAAEHHTHSFVRQRLAYRTQGIYVQFLREWLSFFNREQLLVLRSEDQLGLPDETYAQITDFLGIDRYDDVVFERYNEGKEKEQLPTKIREELDAFFAPYNQELETLLGRKMFYSLRESDE